MKKNNNISFEIDCEILKDYVETINSMKKPMSQIKKELSDDNKSFSAIKKLSKEIKKYLNEFPREHYKIFTDTIKQIMNTNNGMISTRMIEPLNISRWYLLMMENNNDIEKISRGIYISPDVFEDSYFSFQQKYKKVIFSHMNSLYFYGMTEEFPYNYTVTVPQSYHVSTVNDKCNVFYVSDEIYEMGVVEVKTPSGNKVRVYDKERCICDIIRSKNRMDIEQVRKTIKQYIQSSDKDMAKLSRYSKKMGISKEVMETVGGIYYNV